MAELNLKGMALADGVVETIVAIAVEGVDGVASVGGSANGGLRSVFASRPHTQGIEVLANDDDTLSIAVRIEVYGGTVLPDVAAEVRSSVADAVLSQIGLTVGSVDVYIDAVQFAN